MGEYFLIDYTITKLKTRLSFPSVLHSRVLVQLPDIGKCVLCPQHSTPHPLLPVSDLATGTLTAQLHTSSL